VLLFVCFCSPLLFFLLTSAQPNSTLFPYTTLFRSNLQGLWNGSTSPAWDSKYTININTEMNYWPAEKTSLSELHEPLFKMIEERSEEHTSELQSRENLVCRLLLEKKKKKTQLINIK